MKFRIFLSKFSSILGNRREFLFSPLRYFLTKYLHFDFSLFDIQKKVISLFNKKKSLFFIELGAADGIRQSNTSLLEFKYGWSGLLIEPNPAAFSLCRKRRTHSIVINAFVSDKNVGLLGNSSLSLQNTSIDTRYADSFAPVVKLNDLLNSISVNHVDFFSLDVEGSEMDVLTTIDFDNIRINYLLVETNNYDEVSCFLNKWFIFKSKLSFHDYLFVNRSII